MKYLPEGLIAGLACTNALFGIATEQSTSSIVAMASLIGILGGCLVWALKHVLAKTVPQLQEQHAAIIEKVCAAFESRGKEDREAMRDDHKGIAAALAKVGDAVAEGSDLTRELLYRQEVPPRALRVLQPSSLPGPHPGPADDPHQGA